VPLKRTLPIARALLLGAAAAAAFIALSVTNLDSQGAYYDELHQAPASFNYLGSRFPVMNSDFHGIPILNMSYSGAIKSNLYGLYLKFVRPQFTIYSWRLVGIVAVALGIFAFYQIAGAHLTLPPAVAFAVLLVTDASVILASRHDWGPVALSLSLRLIFLAIWLSLALSEHNQLARVKYFVAGLVVGIAVFEKLSAVVLLAPLCLLILTTGARKAHAWMMGALGLAVGSLPLLFVNIGSEMRGAGLVSLSGVATGVVDRLTVPKYAGHYLSLGQGTITRAFILGETESAKSWFALGEAILVLVALLIVIVASLRIGRVTVAAVLAVTYLVVGGLVYLLPRATFIHHWVLGTPFHYAAIAMGLSSFDSLTQTTREHRLYRTVCIAAVLALIAIRIPAVASVERSFASGRASQRFHPAFTRVGELAAAKSEEAGFIAADWGTGIQVFCLSNGNDDLIHEPFWNADPEKAILSILEGTSKDALYVLVTGIAPQFRETSATILRVISNHPGWEEVPVEKEFVSLTPIQIRKFMRKEGS
jgi:hypothetical protein